MALEFRGEIVTVPAEKGDVRNLTNTPARARALADLVAGRAADRVLLRRVGRVRALPPRQDGKGEPKKWKLPGAGFYESPPGRPTAGRSRTSTTRERSTGSTSATGVAKKIGADHLYGPLKTLRAAWSPDSRWIAYTP